MMREFLVTKFACVRCGANLQISYDRPRGSGSHAKGEPTGAEMVQMVVSVEPCQCVTRPLDEMRKAAKALLGE